MTPQEFSEKIKEKYPQYRNQDDVELARAMVNKFPQYQSQVTFEKKREQPKLGTWEGFVDPFKQSAIGIGKGLGKLALGVGTMGRTIQGGVGRAVGRDLKETSIFDVGSEQRAKAEEFLAPTSTGQGVSSFTTEVGATMLPSGAAVKATKGLGFARAMLGRGISGAGIGTIQGGGDIDRDTAIGAASEVAFPIAGRLIRTGGNILKGIAGVAGGTGTDVIEQVIKTPRSALAGAAGDSTTALKETATTLRQGVKELQKRAGNEFAALTKNHTEQLDKNAFKQLMQSFLDDVNETTFISTSKLDKLRNAINTWNDYSAQGLNKLASKISKFYGGTQNTVDTDRVVSGLNRTIRDWIGQQVPDIAEANARYADKMDLIEQMDAIFKLRGSVDDRLGLQKTAEAVSRLFNANKDIAREGVEELQREIGVDILGREAGRQLGANQVTRFQVAEGATGIARSLIPQKTILRLAAAVGIAKEAIESRLDTLEPAARATVIEVLTDLLGEGEGQDQSPKSTQTQAATNQ